MTDRELMQQALEALDRVISHAQEAEDILLAALSEGTEQPQRTHWKGCEEVHPECRKQRQWVGLTDEEMVDLQDGCGISIHQSDFEAIEAKLKEKNT